MSRSRPHLHRIIFGAGIAGCMVFGSAQAFATPQVGTPIPVSCNPYDRNSSVLCIEACDEAGYARGYCAGNGGCRCLS